jgi:phosphohistidine phosphatase
MKTLLLMRHAKSSWASPGLPDKARPLNKRGKRDAPRMGQLLWEHGLVPECMLSSSATRARQTAEAVAEAAHFDGEIMFLEELYGAELEDYERALRNVPDSCSTSLLISHNPGLEQLLDALTRRTEPMPTGAIAWLRLPLEKWSDFRLEAAAELVQVWRPKSP